MTLAACNDLLRVTVSVGGRQFAVETDIQEVDVKTANTGNTQ